MSEKTVSTRSSPGREVAWPGLGTRPRPRRSHSLRQVPSLLWASVSLLVKRGLTSVASGRPSCLRPQGPAASAIWGRTARRCGLRRPGACTGGTQPGPVLRPQEEMREGSVPSVDTHAPQARELEAPSLAPSPGTRPIGNEPSPLSRQEKEKKRLGQVAVRARRTRGGPVATAGMC